MVVRLIFMTMILLLSACASSPSVQYYVLEPIAPSSQTTVGFNSQRSIGIGPISLPALLESKKIVTRLSESIVQVAQFQQWATPLQDNLLHTIARNVSSLQPNTLVRAYPWHVHGTVDLQIIIDIIRFDTSPGKSANLEANWTIKNEETNTVLKNGRTVIEKPLVDKSYPGTVHALSKILGDFSKALSLPLLQLE